MGETSGSEIGLQVLQAVQGLGTRMDRLEQGLNVRMDRLESRMDKLEEGHQEVLTRLGTVDGWLERLGAEFMTLRTDVQNGLGDSLRTRTDVQQMRTEAQQTRADAERTLMDAQLLQGQLREQWRQFRDRLDQTNDALVVMGSGARRLTLERFEELSQRLGAVEVR